MPRPSVCLFNAEQNVRLEGYVRAAAAGDRESVEWLYGETSPVLFALALRILDQSADAEEVLLDVYFRAWQQAASYSSERGSVMAWLITMTRSVAIDRLRHRAARGRTAASVDAGSVPLAHPGPSPELHATMEQERVRVRLALEQLPREQRELLELAYFEGATQSELAVRLGVPLGTVKTRMRLGLQRLRSLFEGGAAPE